MTKNNSVPLDLNLLLNLRQKLTAETTAEIRFDAASRAIYACEASNYWQLPIGVVIPRTLQDIVTTVALCNGAGLPLLPRGAGPSMCGARAHRGNGRPDGS
ncbi:FAD-binding oxidoreductase [Pseudomonas putida]